MNIDWKEPPMPFTRLSQRLHLLVDLGLEIGKLRPHRLPEVGGVLPIKSLRAVDELLVELELGIEVALRLGLLFLYRELEVCIVVVGVFFEIFCRRSEHRR